MKHSLARWRDRRADLLAPLELLNEGRDTWSNGQSTTDQSKKTIKRWIVDLDQLLARYG